MAGATGIEPISPVLETAILTVVLRPYLDYFTIFLGLNVKMVRIKSVWAKTLLLSRSVHTANGITVPYSQRLNTAPAIISPRGDGFRGDGYAIRCVD